MFRSFLIAAVAAATITGASAITAPSTALANGGASFSIQFGTGGHHYRGHRFHGHRGYHGRHFRGHRGFRGHRAGYHRGCFVKKTRHVRYNRWGERVIVIDRRRVCR